MDSRQEPARVATQSFILPVQTTQNMQTTRTHAVGSDGQFNFRWNTVPTPPLSASNRSSSNTHAQVPSPVPNNGQSSFTAFSSSPFAPLLPPNGLPSTSAPQRHSVQHQQGANPNSAHQAATNSNPSWARQTQTSSAGPQNYQQQQYAVQAHTQPSAQPPNNLWANMQTGTVVPPASVATSPVEAGPRPPSSSALSSSVQSRSHFPPHHQQPSRPPPQQQVHSQSQQQLPHQPQPHPQQQQQMQPQSHARQVSSSSSSSSPSQPQPQPQTQTQPHAHPAPHNSSLTHSAMLLNGLGQYLEMGYKHALTTFAAELEALNRQFKNQKDQWNAAEAKAADLEKQCAQGEAERLRLQEECRQEKEARETTAKNFTSMQNAATQFMQLCRAHRQKLLLLQSERDKAVAALKAITAAPQERSTSSMLADIAHTERAKSGHVQLVQVGEYSVPQKLYDSLRAVVAGPLIQEYEGKFAQLKLSHAAQRTKQEREIASLRASLDQQSRAAAPLTTGLQLDVEPHISVRPRQDVLSQAPPTPPAEPSLPPSLSRIRGSTAPDTPDDARASSTDTSSSLPDFLASLVKAADRGEPAIQVKEENADLGAWPWNDKEIIDLTAELDSPLPPPPRELDEGTLEAEFQQLSQELMSMDVRIPDEVEPAERKRPAESTEDDDSLLQGEAKRPRVSAAEDIVMEDAVVNAQEPQDVQINDSPTDRDDGVAEGETVVPSSTVNQPEDPLVSAVEGSPSISHSEDDNAMAVPPEPIVDPPPVPAPPPGPDVSATFPRPVAVPPPAAIPLPPEVEVKAEADDPAVTFGLREMTASASTASPARRSLSMRHLNLAYYKTESRLICRMCLHRREKMGDQIKCKSFPLTAGMPELSGHCEIEHPASFTHLLNMSPARIAETETQILAQHR